MLPRQFNNLPRPPQLSQRPQPAPPMYPGKKPSIMPVRPPPQQNPMQQQARQDYRNIRKDFGGKAPMPFNQFNKATQNPQGQQAIQDYMAMSKGQGGAPMPFNQFNRATQNPQGQQAIQDYMAMSKMPGGAPFTFDQFSQMNSTPQGQDSIREQLARAQAGGGNFVPDLPLPEDIFAQMGTMGGIGSTQMPPGGMTNQELMAKDQAEKALQGQGQPGAQFGMPPGMQSPYPMAQPGMGQQAMQAAMQAAMQGQMGNMQQQAMQAAMQGQGQNSGMPFASGMLGGIGQAVQSAVNTFPGINTPPPVSPYPGAGMLGGIGQAVQSAVNTFPGINTPPQQAQQSNFANPYSPQTFGSVPPPANVGAPPSPTQGTPATQGTPNAAPAAGANAQPQQPSGGGLF